MDDKNYDHEWDQTCKYINTKCNQIEYKSNIIDHDLNSFVWNIYCVVSIYVVCWIIE